MYRWGLVALLFTVGALNYCDRTAISAVLPLLRAEFGMSDVALASLGSMFLWSYGLASPLAGVLADRWPRPRLVVWSLAAWTAVTLGMGFARTVPQLLAARVLLGLAEAVYLPAAVALIADHHQPERRGGAIGIHTAGLVSGTIAGGTLAGYLGDRFGWRVTFIILGLAGIALAAAAQIYFSRGYTRPLPAPRKTAQPPATVSSLFRNRAYVLLLAQAMLTAIGVWALLNWLPLYFRDVRGLTLMAAGFTGTFLLQAPAVAGLMLGGFLSDRAARRSPARRMWLLALCCAAAAPMPLGFLGKTTLGVLAACILGFALFRALGQANESAIMCDLLPSSLRSTAVGLANTANCLAGGLGVFLAGWWKQDYGLGSVFAGVSVLLLASALLAWAGYKVYPRSAIAAEVKTW